MATNTTPKQKTFKVSDLTELSANEFDDEDLFLVSDYDDGKCYTKKITKKTLFNALTNDPDLIQRILDSQSELDEQIQEKVNTKVEEAFDIRTIDGGNAHGE